MFNPIRHVKLKVWVVICIEPAMQNSEYENHDRSFLELGNCAEC